MEISEKIFLNAHNLENNSRAEMKANCIISKSSFQNFFV